MEEVLRVIRILKGNIKLMEIEYKYNLEKGIQEQGHVTPTSKDEVTAELALKYVCWLADVNNLYDVALGMYDFDLVNMVAQKSQKVSHKNE